MCKVDLEGGDSDLENELNEIAPPEKAVYEAPEGEHHNEDAPTEDDVSQDPMSKIA
jgi:hypothetical protein